MGNLSKATKELREAGRLAPKVQHRLHFLAHAMIAEGQTRKATYSLRHALELRPGNAALMKISLF